MRTCSICSHKQRKQIEAAIGAGESNRRIAPQFSTSESAVRRHKENCIKPIIEQVVQEQRAETKRTFMTAVDRVLRDLALIEEALAKVWSDKGKDLELLLRVLPESRQQNKLYADLTGELKRQVNVFTTPEWQSVWQLVFSELDEAHQQRVIVRLEEERAKRRGA